MFHSKFQYFFAINGIEPTPHAPVLQFHARQLSASYLRVAANIDIFYRKEIRGFCSLNLIRYMLKSLIKIKRKTGCEFLWLASSKAPYYYAMEWEEKLGDRPTRHCAIALTSIILKHLFECLCSFAQICFPSAYTSSSVLHVKHEATDHNVFVLPWNTTKQLHDIIKQTNI